MKLKEYDILLDLKKHKQIEEIEVVAGDYGSNILNITITEGVENYDLTNLSVEIAFVKSDGTTVLQDLKNGIELIGNKIICTLKTNTIAKPGQVIAEVRVTEGLKLLTTARFRFFVRKAIVDDKTIESTNEYPVLNELISDVNGLIDDVKSKPEIRGYSAYEVWVNNGNMGTVDDYLKSLKGDKGDKGDTGAKGATGERGPTGSIENLDKGNIEDALGYKPVKSVNTKIGESIVLSTTDIGPSKDRLYMTSEEKTNINGTVSALTDTGTVTNINRRQVNISESSSASGNKSQVNCSANSTASSTYSQINTSLNCSISGSIAQINASKLSTTTSGYAQINVSTNVLNDSSFVSVWGLGDTPSVQNKKVEISSYYGTIKATGAITGNSSFADFAEYFESDTGKAIPLGTIVSLASDGKIKIPESGDYMVGIVSQTAGIILNAQGFEWKDRYLYDRYGQPILVDKEVINEETGEVEVIKTQMLNINYKEDEEYVGREDREEWNVVGLTGQIFVNVDDTVREGDFIQVGQNGIGTKGRNEYGQNWQVMKITTPYEENLGFGIAMVFVR